MSAKIDANGIRTRNHRETCSGFEVAPKVLNLRWLV